MSAADGEEIGIVGEVIENGLPVIYVFLDELPSQERMSTLPHLTVVA